MEQIPKPPIPTDFIYGQESRFPGKVGLFIKEGSDNLHLIFDFDRTLTIGRGAEDVTTWHILKSHMPAEGQHRYQELFEENRAHELNGTMDEARAVAWWSNILDLFVEHKVDIKAVEHDFLDKASIRPQAQELFSVCEQAGIPTIIMSAGIKDVISVWSRAYNINPTIVLSTSLKLNANGIAEGWNKDSLVHILNKKEIDHPELSRIRLERPNAIIIGDSLNDADMASGVKNVMRVRVYDPREDETDELDAVRTRTFEQFDTIIETGNLSAVRELIQQVVGVTPSPYSTDKYS
jgi:HAD superfamily phosphoserine phosphatase-like hydrolase